MLVKPFSTARQCYAYDTNTNAIATISPAVHDYLTGVEQPKALREAIEIGLKDARAATHLFQDSHPETLRPFFTDDEISHRLKHARKALMLQVTDACNLRCDYCIYGGTYDGRPLHGKLLMSFALARQAIDDYLAHTDETEGELALGFYGGEPFVNFKLMRQALDYFRKGAGNRETVCALTTNATLLDDRAVDWLAENHVSATISIDGPRQVHDAHRRTVKDAPTFDAILARLERMRDRQPVYFDQMLRLSVTLVPPVDFNALDRFFTGFPVTRLSISHVDSFGSDHAAPTADERHQYKGFQEMLDKHRKAAIAGHLARRVTDPDLALIDAMFTPTLRKIHNRHQTVGLPRAFTPAGLCVPGADKTYVGPTGDYYVCEKVDGNDHMRIGDVATGLDCNRVIRLTHAFYDFLGKGCTTCWAARLCGICFAHIAHDHALSAEKRAQNCHLKRQNLALLLRHYCAIREEAPDAFAALDA